MKTPFGRRRSEDAVRADRLISICRKSQLPDAPRDGFSSSILSWCSHLSWRSSSATSPDHSKGLPRPRRARLSPDLAATDLASGRDHGIPLRTRSSRTTSARRRRMSRRRFRSRRPACRCECGLREASPKLSGLSAAMGSPCTSRRAASSMSMVDGATQRSSRILGSARRSSSSGSGERVVAGVKQRLSGVDSLYGRTGRCGIMCPGFRHEIQ